MADLPHKDKVDSMKEISEIDRRLIYELSGDLGESLSPYADLAEKVGLNEAEVIRLIREYQSQNIIRRFGATLWHQRSGFAANAMVVFEVSNDRAEEAGRSLAGRSYVSHCYLRKTAQGWPYNLYVMIHAESRDDILRMTKEMAELVGTDRWRMLESLKELKKASRRYFAETINGRS